MVSASHEDREGQWKLSSVGWATRRGHWCTIVISSCSKYKLLESQRPQKAMSSEARQFINRQKVWNHSYGNQSKDLKSTLHKSCLPNVLSQAPIQGTQQKIIRFPVPSPSLRPQPSPQRWKGKLFIPEFTSGLLRHYYFRTAAVDMHPVITESK